jgi:hypothetical protein
MRLFLLVSALLLGACSSGADTLCGQACEKLHGCGVHTVHITSEKLYSFGDDCSVVPCDKVSECIARCFDAASCGELTNVVLNGPFHSCLAACSGFFRVP